KRKGEDNPFCAQLKDSTFYNSFNKQIRDERSLHEKRNDYLGLDSNNLAAHYCNMRHTMGWVGLYPIVKMAKSDEFASQFSIS
ncbi:hypothetical protein HAX54_013720, partial [Datura stramonium]|nr:hypothetical protein [Datura stramonium]